LLNLGTTKLEIAPLALGGNVFGWTADEATSFAVLDAFVDRGYNLIDTADMYSRWVPGHVGGESETILGKWFAQGGGRREQVVLATKVGVEMGEGKKGLSARYIRAAVEDSLRRLQTDRIDLYQSHTDDDHTPLEETLQVYDELVSSGKVRYIGASNYKGNRLRQALETSRHEDLVAYKTLQPNYNLHTREEYEKDLAPVVAEYKLAVLPYFALGSGFLTGKYKTKEDAVGAKREAMVGRYFDARGEKILAALASVSEESGEAQASIALAWLLTRPNIAAPIASATSVEQLEAHFRGAEMKLSAEQLKTLDEASAY
jgi:aryl-alcohol dehydrogenase-like predicted oxidoreductase